MHRSKILTLLHAYNPEDKEEIEAKQRMLSFIEQNVDCFERSLSIGHMTASVWLLSKDGSQALVMHHAKLNVWCQLGGHCDGDTDILAVALKEAQEESGIKNIIPVSCNIFDIDIHFIPENSREKEHYHYDVRFLVRVASDEHVVKNSESKELRWIGKDRSQLPTDNRSVVRMFDKWINGN
ncbi:MAG TPA: NUDIX hydrolase [Candidatus Saccharimonadales bacterium]|nr:NUDIX hydrolase [Candidatus Saccharimonadales bacterium]